MAVVVSSAHVDKSIIELPELCNSTHSPVVQSFGPTAPVSDPKAFTSTSEIQTSPLQTADPTEVSEVLLSSERLDCQELGLHMRIIIQ